MEILRLLLGVFLIGIPILCAYLWKTKREALGKGIGAGLLADLIGATIYGMLSNMTQVYKSGQYGLAMVLMIVCLAGGLGIIVAITKIYDEKTNKEYIKQNKERKK